MTGNDLRRKAATVLRAEATNSGRPMCCDELKTTESEGRDFA